MKPVKELRIQIYEDRNGTLHYVSEGSCLAYAPEGTLADPYVSFNFGRYHFHISLEDFRELIKNVR